MPYQTVIKTIGAVSISISVLITPNSASAEIDSFKVGQVTGAYLGASDLMIKVSESHCQKYVTKKYDFDVNKNELLSYLNEQNKNELISFLNGNGMRVKRRENFILIESYLDKMKSEGLSDDFVCGSIIGIASALYTETLKDWNHLKEEIINEKDSASKTQAITKTSEYCETFGDIGLESSYYLKNEQLEKELYKHEITEGKWSRSYRKIKKQLETREEQFKAREQLIEKMCRIKDIYSSEYYNLELKIKVLEEVLEMYK